MKRKLALMFIVIVLALVGLSIRIVYINETNGEKYTKKMLQQQDVIFFHDLAYEAQKAMEEDALRAMKVFANM